MNEVTTFERVGRRAGAAVDSGVKTTRQRAKEVRRNAERVREQLAERVPERTAALTERAGQAQEVLSEHLGPTVQALAERWGVAQDVLADWLVNARHELAARIEPEPEPAPRRRWPWLALLLGVVAGVAGAAILARRPQEIDPDEPFPYPAEGPGSADSTLGVAGGVAGGGADNGAIGADRPSADAE